MARMQKGPKGPINEVDELPSKTEGQDPTNLVGDEEETTEKQVGYLDVDTTLDPIEGRSFDLISPEDGNPEGGGAFDPLGDPFAPFRDRAREGIDVTSPMDEADPGDGSPGAKFGPGFISAGKGAKAEVVDVELDEHGTLITTWSDGRVDFEYPDGTTVSTPAPVLETYIEIEPLDKSGWDEPPGSDPSTGSDPPPDSEEPPATGNVNDPSVINLSGIGEAVNDFFNSIVSNGSNVKKDGGSPPDEDYVSPEERERLREMIGGASPGVDIDKARRGGANDGGDIDFPEAGNVNFEGAGPVPDIKDRYLGGDNIEPERGGGRPVGDPPAGGNTKGNTTPAWDAPADPSGSGPYERNKAGGAQQTRNQQAPVLDEPSIFERVAGVRDHSPEPNPSLSGARRDQGLGFELNESSKSAVAGSAPVPQPVQPVVVSSPRPFEPIGIDTSTGTIESPTKVVSALSTPSDTEESSGDSQGSADAEGTVTFTDAEAGDDAGSTGTGSGDDSEKDEDQSPGLTVGSHDTPIADDLDTDPTLDPPVRDGDGDVVGPQPPSIVPPEVTDEGGLTRAPIVDYQERHPALEIGGGRNSDAGIAIDDGVIVTDHDPVSETIEQVKHYAEPEDIPDQLENAEPTLLD